MPTTAGLGGASGSATPSSIPFFTQPPFDKRIRDLTFPMREGAGGGTPLERGYMIWDAAIPGYSKRAVVHFLYNPSTIMVSYAMQDSTTENALYWMDGASKTNVLIPLTQTVEFTLQFNRMYELWGSASNASATSPHVGSSTLNDPSKSGVGVDLLSFMQLTGTLKLANQVSTTGLPKGITFTQGPIFPLRTWVFFGNSPIVQYFGFVSGWDYQITSWTQAMVPMTCSVDVEFNLWPQVEAFQGGSNPPDDQWSWLINPSSKSSAPATTRTSIH